MTQPLWTPAPPSIEAAAEPPVLPFGDQLFQRLLRHRIIFLGQQVDDDIANRICAELALLASEDSQARHQHLHQLPGRLGLRGDGHLRHDAVRTQ